MKTYAVSDLHGNMDLYNKILDIVGDNKLVVLGDLCDRGPDGYAMIKDALKRENIIYLQGNHESLFIYSAWGYMGDEERYLHNPDVAMHISNGGEPTLRAWIEDNCQKDILFAISNLSVSYTYKTENNQLVFLTHSGGLKDTLWDRTHFGQEVYIPDDIVIVHGHTPIQIIQKTTDWLKEDCARCFDEDGKVIAPLVYNGGHKINLDCGTYATNQSILLDLDTLKPTIIS